MTKGSFEKIYTVNSYDVDSLKRMDYVTILKYFQDIGFWQDNSIKSKEFHDFEDGVAWIFIQYDIKIYDNFKWKDDVYVVTKPCYIYKFYAYRKYILKDKNGKIYVEAFAKFVAIDLKNRKLKRIPENLFEFYGVESNDVEKVSMDNLKKVERIDYMKEFSVRYSDIDMYKHVNNTNYLKWALENVPIDILKDKRIENIKINFRKESLYGDTIIVNTEQNENLFIHEIVNKSTNEKLALVETKFI